MKTTKILYWIVTGFLSFMMLYSAYAYLTQAQMAQGFAHLGFPSYFRIELAIAKIMGVGVLLLPVNRRVKEWAYAGFGITFLSAFIAHTASGDPVAMRIMPVIALALLSVSYIIGHPKSKMAAESSSLPATAIL